MIVAVSLRGSFDGFSLECASVPGRLLHCRGLEDALHGSIQKRIELGIALLRCQSLDQSSRKTRDDTMIPAQARVGIIPRVASRECKDPNDPGMSYEFGI